MTALFVAVALAAPPQFHAFIFEGTSVVLDSSGKVVQKVQLTTLPLLASPTDLEVSPDGKMLAVTAFSAEVNNTLLYQVDLTSLQVRRIGEPKGFHAAPSFSRDGVWVQFAHHATLGGPVGMHELRQYAQLYRQRIGSDAPAEQLTTSDGCHMESSSSSGEVIYFAHANCRGGRRIEVFRAGREAAITSFDSHLGEPALSNDGKWLVATRVTGDLLEIVELELAHPEVTHILWSGTRFQDQFRPKYLDASRAVVFQNGPSVFRISRARKTGEATELFNFKTSNAN